MQSPIARTVYDLLHEIAGKTPNAPFAFISGEEITYRQMADRSATVAGRLQENGITRGDVIGLLCNNRIEWLDICFGAAGVGAVLAPFSTWSTTSELEFLLEDAGACSLFTLSKYGRQNFHEGIQELKKVGKLQNLTNIIALDTHEFDEYLKGPVLASKPPGDGRSAGDNFVYLYTSGSSSRPKCVPLTHWASIENGFNIGERMGLSGIDRVLISIPLFWSYGAANALIAVLSHGSAMILQQQFEPAGALELIEEHRATALYTLPAMTNALLAEPSFTPQRTKSLRTGLTIGSPQDIIRAANELGANEICNIYGQTESYGNCSVTPHHWPLERRAYCQGPPLPGVRIRITDPKTGQPMASDDVGEIQVHGYLTPGYGGQSSIHNDEVFTEDGFFRTGDLGSLNSDGTVFYAGRSSEMIKRSGINVSPAEVEEALQKDEYVGLAGVSGVPDPDKGEIIVAFVILRPGTERNAIQLRDHCKQLLSSYKLPDRIFFVSELPLTPTGKLMRRDLRNLAINAVADGELS